MLVLAAFVASPPAGRAQEPAASPLYLPVILAPAPTPTATSTPVPTATPVPTPTAIPAGPCSCAGNLYNCPDFSTQRSAQACFAYCLDQVGYDIHRLDGDNDGVACESLP